MPSSSGEVICPATRKPCPEQNLGELPEGWECSGPKRSTGLILEFCMRQEIKTKGSLMSDIIKNALDEMDK
jgi:hypothetical protein